MDEEEAFDDTLNPDIKERKKKYPGLSIPDRAPVTINDAFGEEVLLLTIFLFFKACFHKKTNIYII